MPKLVLIIEDNPDQALLMLHSLTEAGIEVAMADNLTKAKMLLNELLENVSLIILDACLNPWKEVDTPPLIALAISAGFTGPIVASSSHEESNEQLVAAGATHQALKWDAPQLALQLLAAS